MGYWEHVVKAFLPKAENVVEDWDARTVSFEAACPDGSLVIGIDQVFIDWMKDTFGSTDIVLTASPDTRYSRDKDYNYMTGVRVRLAIQNVRFPKRPGEA